MSDPLAAKLTEIRLREGLGVNEMAQRIGVNQAQLSRILNGKAEVTRRVLDSAASVFPELLAAHAASLIIRADSTATTPHGDTDATRNLNASTQRPAFRTRPTTDREPVVPGMRKDAPTLEAAVSRDAGDPLPVL